MTKIVAISDTHNRHKKVEIPECDILIHCGDMSGRGHRSEIINFLDWFVDQPAKSLALIAGNHDFLYEKDPTLARSILADYHFNEGSNRHYLEDDLVVIGTLMIYGSPYTPYFFNLAFNLQRGEDLARKWSIIPDDLDILVTHGPPYQLGDRTERGEEVGCHDLLTRIKQIRVQYHLCGHIHECGNQIHKLGATTFMNCCICDLKYNPVNPPFVFEIFTDIGD